MPINPQDLTDLVKVPILIVQGSQPTGSVARALLVSTFAATDAFPGGCCQYASPLECQMPISQLDCEGNSGTYVQGTICSETGECIAPKIVFATSTTHDGPGQRHEHRHVDRGAGPGHDLPHAIDRLGLVGSRHQCRLRSLAPGDQQWQQHQHQATTQPRGVHWGGGFWDEGSLPLGDWGGVRVSGGVEARPSRRLGAADFGTFPDNART